jgi:catechol 2,3-dioxygenase-like lactoylglutathione lyase family enzyme
MLAGAAVTAFLATTDSARAFTFYCDKLGLRRVSDDDFALVLDANGVELRLQKVAMFTPHPFTALGWRVEDIGGVVSLLAANGVTLERFDGLSQDGQGIWDAPSGARVAWFRDPDGNLLSVAQYPATIRSP